MGENTEPNWMATLKNNEVDFRSERVTRLRADLALALRAAAQHGFTEGVCTHFSVELPDGPGRFLLNPHGLLWSEVGVDDIVMVDAQGSVSAGRHAVEPTAMFIHAVVHRIANKACALQVIAQSTGRPRTPVAADIAERVARQVDGERVQSELFFEALRRTV